MAIRKSIPSISQSSGPIITIPALMVTPPPPQQEGIGDTEKMNIGEGATGYSNRSPVIFGKTVHHVPVHQDVTIRSKLLNRRGYVSTIGHSGSEATNLETKKSVRKASHPPKGREKTCRKFNEGPLWFLQDSWDVATYLSPANARSFSGPALTAKAISS